jgi:hypothetical protein
MMRFSLALVLAGLSVASPAFAQQTSGLTSSVGGSVPATSAPDASTLRAPPVGSTLSSTTVGGYLSNGWPTGSPNGNYTPQGWSPKQVHPGYTYGFSGSGLLWARDPVTGIVQAYGTLENSVRQRQSGN